MGVYFVPNHVNIYTTLFSGLAQKLESISVYLFVVAVFYPEYDERFGCIVRDCVGFVVCETVEIFVEGVSPEEL